MTVDAFYKSAGLKLRSNVYSFGAVQIHLKVERARLIRLSLDLPNRSMEVISIRTDVLLVNTNGAETKEQLVGKLLTGEKSKRDEVVPENIISNTTCTWSAVERLIGLKLCADYQFPNVTKNSNASCFVLNGPTLFKISVIKADPTAKNYLLEYKWESRPVITIPRITLETFGIVSCHKKFFFCFFFSAFSSYDYFFLLFSLLQEESIVKMAFDTPGSQMNRELSATVTFGIKNHNVTVLLRSAGNSLEAKGTNFILQVSNNFHATINPVSLINSQQQKWNTLL